MNIFLNKKILIYGLGKSGLSTFYFLKNKSDVYLFDDSHLKIQQNKINRYSISLKKIKSFKFDYIILSPGIDINKCKLSKFLKKNQKIIHTDLDVFFEFYKNDYITITGTNGKSTTCQLLYEILLKQRHDVRLVGNIGNPVLSTRNVKKKTIFVIEASSYQLDYSKIFRTKYAAILNLSSDHLERHGTLNRYIKSKFKLIKNQHSGNFAFVKKDDLLIRKYLRSNKFKCKIIKVHSRKSNKFLEKIDNKYFLTENNKENLSFALEILKKIKIKKTSLIKTVKNFKGLKYRQQIIYNKKNLTIINDSKSTSLSSSSGILKVYPNIYWLIGGVNKKGDKLKLSNKYFNRIKAFIYGKDTSFFKKELDGKIEYRTFKNLENALQKILKIVNNEKIVNQTILFSPSAASFDRFKNFEDRGSYFNQLIKKYFYGK